MRWERALSNIILFGFKSCGKTYFGKRLAEKLAMTFIDTDSLIEELYAQEWGACLSCRSIALRIGESAFRALEKRTILQVQVEQAVIAVGGGTVLDPDNYRILASWGKLVYLHMDKEKIKQRILRGGLPSFKSSFEEMYWQRKEIYEKINAITIDISSKGEEEILSLLSRV